MNNVVKAVRSLRTLTPEEYKLAIALSRSVAGRSRKPPSKPKSAKRGRKRIEPQPEAA